MVAVIGDSIARSLDPAFLTLAQEHDWTYVLAATNGCRITNLLSSPQAQVRPKDQRCYDNTPRLLDDLLAAWRPSLIVAVDRHEITDFVSPGGGVIRLGTPEHAQRVDQALRDLAVRLTSSGSRLAFIELPPTVPAKCAQSAGLDSPECRVPVSADRNHPAYNAIFREIADSMPRVSAISITDAICPSGVCEPVVDGVLVRYDGLHFSEPGARRLAPVIYRNLVAAGALPG